MEYGYKGNFMVALTKAISNNPQNTLGEILLSALHPSKYKRGSFFFATDEEICYNFEEFNKIDMQDDIPTNQEFEDWLSSLKYEAKL